MNSSIEEMWYTSKNSNWDRSDYFKMPDMVDAKFLNKIIDHPLAVN